MRKKEIILIGIMLVLVGCYLKFFKNWDKPHIDITPSIRPPSRNSAATVFPVIFSLDHPYALTSVEVVPDETNKAGVSSISLWHLVAKSNSTPTKIISYGVPIRGMQPAIPRLHPQALTPGMIYRIILMAGDIKGEAQFKTKAMPQRN